MEDLRITKLQKELDIKIKELEQTKKDSNFEKNIESYNSLKADAKKVKAEISKETDTSKIEELNAKVKSIENQIKEVISKFKPVEAKEKQLYSLKGKVDNLIISVDYRRNTADSKVKKMTFENEDLTEVVNRDKVIKSLETENKKLTTRISELTKEIELRSSKGEFVSREKEELRTSNKVIKANEAKIKKLNASSIDTSKDKIEKNKVTIESLKKDSKEYQKQIDVLLKLITKINDGLSFIDSDEINTDTSFQVENLNVYYGSKQALFNVNLELPRNEVIAIIGPSGCGKSTFLRTLNRINDNIPSFSAEGKIILDGEYDIFKLKSIRNRYDKIKLSTLRTKVGMIFQQPNPFPMSIAKNVQYGPKVKGIKNSIKLSELTEQALKDAGLWEEVKDNLKALGTSLSGGQQQRLCIARAIANEPEILLMDEPTSALDPIASKKIEDLILKLKEHYTIIMVTHSMQQAQRISDYTAFFYQGELIEYGTTKQVFETPKQKETKDYISGKFG